MSNILQYIDLADLLDPTVLVVFGGIIIKIISPFIKAKHLDQKATNIFNAAKVACTFAAKQTGLDNDQKRMLAEKQLVQWAADHKVKLNKERTAATIEYAYQFLKNGSVIDIKQDNHNVDQDSGLKTGIVQSGSANLPNMDPKFKYQIEQKQGGKN
ncbi:phage holin, LLH family [Fructilactobacillus myrtifloralis]|uniref:Phage holin, LLH family n=1 Tax=Fructilactobacillus myrtifloralis TaxID=2940301 RepID=A0ABY5BN49_9LACO|nr:phage holin, LLH family [Fructilactobacillus myrtifloralis]USS85095.1 phage holin, LLH family [Fructilactobacillus myrtifloralis]